MINRILKLIIFSAAFSMCYFFSCSGLSTIMQSPCEDECSANNIECSRNCETFYRSNEMDSAGNGCNNKYSECLEKCEQMYKGCIERCRVEK